FLQAGRRRPRQRGWCRLQMMSDFREAAFRTLASGPGVSLGQARGEQPGPVLKVIEGDDPIVEADGQVRYLELIEPRPRPPFRMMRELVAEHAGRTTLVRRQPWNRFRLIAGQAFGQYGEWIGWFPWLRFSAQMYAIPTRPKPLERISR